MYISVFPIGLDIKSHNDSVSKFLVVILNHLNKLTLQLLTFTQQTVQSRNYKLVFVTCFICSKKRKQTQAMTM